MLALAAIVLMTDSSRSPCCRLQAARILCFLGPSAVVGELSMIDGLPRSASVVAAQPH
jgi:CRP-like cAMP-binding protein